MPDTLQNIAESPTVVLDTPATRDQGGASWVLSACLRQQGSQGRAYTPRNAVAPYSQLALGVPQVLVVQWCHPCLESRSNPGREKAENSQGLCLGSSGACKDLTDTAQGSRVVRTSDATFWS